VSGLVLHLGRPRAQAWLRLSTFNCSITYLVVRPTGSVSMRSLGDVGHLPLEKTTFSQHRGLEW
jgi:serine/threonine-protein phosphatase PGAM5